MDSGKHAVTHYELIEAFRHASLLEIRLETGRTHQIRVHMAAVRHPCVGDLTYGADPTLSRTGWAWSGSGCTPSGSVSSTPARGSGSPSRAPTPRTCGSRSTVSEAAPGLAPDRVGDTDPDTPRVSSDRPRMVGDVPERLPAASCDP